MLRTISKIRVGGVAYSIRYPRYVYYLRTYQRVTFRRRPEKKKKKKKGCIQQHRRKRKISRSNFTHVPKEIS